MHKLDLEVKEILLREARLLKAEEKPDAAAEKLAKESVKAYRSRTMRETAEDSSGTRIETHYMKGLFVNEDVEWSLIKPKHKGYTEIPDPRGEMIEKKMGIEENKGIFPPKAIVRDFTEEAPNSKGSKNESFCKAEIRFDSRLMSKSEVENHLRTIRVEANEDSDWASDLTKWLKSQKEYNIYFVVGFEIICEFDFKKYWRERFEEIKEADVELQIRGEGVSVNSDEQKQIEDKMHREVAELAKYAVEYVVEKLVFYDLRDSFKYMCEKIEKDKETGNNKKQIGATAGEPKPLPENRILFYNPLKLKLTATLEPCTNDVPQICLGDQIEATIRIESEGKRRPNFNIDRNFKVIIEDPSYFEAEDEEITFVKGSNEFEEFRPKESKTNGENKVYCVETPKKILLTPKIEEITAKADMAEYPLTFVLKRSTGILATNEGTVPKEDVRQLAKCSKKVAILPPKVTMTSTKKRLPRKGEQFDIEFNLECNGNSNKLLMIPLTIKGYFGNPKDPDFEVVGSAPEKNSGKETGYHTKEFRIRVKGKEKKTFTLLARRASFPGYYCTANFKLEVSRWKTISEWRENMMIFPNLVDTFIAGVTTLLGIAYLYRPDWFPFIADIPALNIANLEAIPAVVYLAYRALNWTKATTAKAASGG